MAHRRPGQHVTALILGAALSIAATACGDNNDETSQPTIPLTAEKTVYQTLPVATTLPEPDEPVATTPSDGAIDADPPTQTDVDEQPVGETIPTPGDGCDPGSHTVVAGDIPLKLVDLYDVTLEALEQANTNNPAYQRFVIGDEIVIPARQDC